MGRQRHRFKGRCAQLVALTVGAQARVRARLCTLLKLAVHQAAVWARLQALGSDRAGVALHLHARSCKQLLLPMMTTRS